MTGSEWFWAGFWLCCGVGWALVVGLIISLVIGFVIALLRAAFDR